MTIEFRKREQVLDCQRHGNRPMIEITATIDHQNYRDVTLWCCEGCVDDAYNAYKHNLICTCCRVPVASGTGIERGGHKIPLCHGCQGKLLRWAGHCPLCMHDWQPLEGCYECGYGFEHGEPQDYHERCVEVGKWLGLKGEPPMAAKKLFHQEYCNSGMENPTLPNGQPTDPRKLDRFGGGS